jgi:hypothetical protein
MTVALVAVLVVDATWWLTRSDPRAAAVAGVAGVWLWLSARERIGALERLGRVPRCRVARNRIPMPRGRTPRSRGRE